MSLQFGVVKGLTHPGLQQVCPHHGFEERDCVLSWGAALLGLTHSPVLSYSRGQGPMKTWGGAQVT